MRFGGLERRKVGFLSRFEKEVRSKWKGRRGWIETEEMNRRNVPQAWVT